MTAPQIALSALDASWSGTTWPPEASSNGLGVSLEGVIVGFTRRLECRRSDVQKGYLASKKTADLNAKYTEISVKLDDKKMVADLKKNLTQGTFIQQIGGGESAFFVSADVVKLWAPPTAVGELAAIMQVSDPLKEGDRVKIYTLGGTMLTKSLEIVSLGKRTGTMSIMGETHMYGVVQGGPVQVDAKGGLTEKIFAAKAGMPSGKAKQPEPSGGEVADEEWD